MECKDCGVLSGECSVWGMRYEVVIVECEVGTEDCEVSSVNFKV